VLGIVFAVAVWQRLRSYDETGAATTVTTAPETVGGTVAPATETTARPASHPADPGVIVSDCGARTTTTLTESERDRRYNELLRGAPSATTTGSGAPSPPAATPAPAPERSAVKHPAEAVGTTRPKPPTPPPQPQPQPLVPSSTPSPMQSPNSSSSSSSHEEAHSEAADDPDSDINPPQLMGVEFLPPAIQDGESTLLAVRAQDNLSGVRSVSGVIGGPTGTVQGFACQREGDSNRYVTRVTIPKDAAPGDWLVKYLTLTDNASNSVNLTLSQGVLPVTARFQVTSSNADTDAPTLRAVRLERAAMRAGDRNTVFVEADDDKTGVNSVNGVFVSPGKQARLSFGCRVGSTGAWECPLTPPSCLDCGVWHLEQLQMQDKANNMATVRADNPLLQPVVVDISGDACDSAPPALSMLALDPVVVSNVEGGNIQVRATIADDGCGVASLSGQAVPADNEGGQHAYFSLTAAADGRTFIGTLVVPKHAAKGMWTIAWLQALDKGHNLRQYPANDPIIARATFRVE
jgi:hypothetical protein